MFFFWWQGGGILSSGVVGQAKTHQMSLDYFYLSLDLNKKYTPCFDGIFSLSREGLVTSIIGCGGRPSASLLWEPFVFHPAVYKTTRNLYKNMLGNKLTYAQGPGDRAFLKEGCEG